MAKLWLRVDKWLDGDNLPNVVYGELKGPGIKGSCPVMLPVGEYEEGYEEWRKTNVDGGRYFLHVTLPSGQLVSRHIDVPPDAVEPITVVMEPPESAHEWLSWSQFLGTVKSDLSLSAVQWRESKRLEQGSFARPIDSFLGPVRPRVELLAYGGETQQWETLPLEQYSKVRVGLPRNEILDEDNFPLQNDCCFQMIEERDEESFLVAFKPVPAEDEVPRFAGRMFLLLSSGIGPPWIASLPLPWASTLDRSEGPAGIEVLLHAEPEYEEPEFALILRDWLMGPMLGYLESGRIGIVDTLQEQFLENAETLLFQKRHNPFGAAAGALVLLKLQAYERLHDWPYNLATWFPWFADGAVVAGWCGLLGMPPNRRARSYFDGASPRALFLAAANSGVPVFTESLHLLVDGLKRCVAAAREKGETDEELAQALNKMRVFGRACAPGRPFTLFRGESPLEPIVLD